MGSSPTLGSYLDVVQSGRTLGLGPRGRRFKSYHLDFWLCRTIWSVRHPVTVEVAGSSPVRVAVSSVA